MINFNELGNKIKWYESRDSGGWLLPNVPAIVRLDGRSFHTFTRGMERPFDKRLVSLMLDTTRFLMKESRAQVAYTQSDEITLIFNTDTPGSEIFFNGRIFKLSSVLAGLASAFFNRELIRTMPEFADRIPVFDARVFNVPTKEEAANALLWRALDAERNSVSMVSHSIFSNEDLHMKSTEQRKAMLLATGHVWETYPDHLKFGTLMTRKKVKQKFTATEIESLPEKHHARTDPFFLVERNIVQESSPKISNIKNLVDVLFSEAVPSYGQNDQVDFAVIAEARNSRRKSKS